MHNGLHGKSVLFFFMHTVSITDNTTEHYDATLTLNLLMWRIWWAPNDASEGQMGFNSALKGLSDMYILTFRGPYIVIYSYNKTNEMHYCISQIYFGKELYMFQMGLLSIIRSLVLYTQPYVFVIQVVLTVWLARSGWNLSKTHRVLYQNKFVK